MPLDQPLPHVHLNPPQDAVERQTRVLNLYQGYPLSIEQRVYLLQCQQALLACVLLNPASIRFACQYASGTFQPTPVMSSSLPPAARSARAD